MSIDFGSFTPLLSLTGGVEIGAAALMLVFFNGRIAGISGILGGLLGKPKGGGWRIAFLAGLVGAPVLASLFAKLMAPDIHAGWNETIHAGWSEILVAGFLVGIGTRYASGCTSGHGVCGISRGSVRSIVATTTFMATGFLTVFVSRHLLGGG
ncbi:MAG: YeeE/YedE family protein [Paraburkholderia sp.]|uniref:YeeE/YedE family protein n=1 Tax=Paraburkholderia sp. TaxID=1926495 RepID=UPI003979AE14